MMRAVVVDPTSTQRHGRRRKPTATVEIRELPMPTIPAPGWVVVRPLLAGICPSDLALVAGRTTPSPLAAYGAPGPIIPGHEVVGFVQATHKTRNAREGDRVILEPQLWCRHKGLPECERCRAGEGHLCENRDRAGPICDGHGVGASLTTGGGWSEAILVHEEMLLPAEGIPDQRAVLAEPTATALHKAMRWQRNGDRVVVVGSGTRTRLIVALLAHLHPHLDITVVYDTRSEDRLTRLGRTHREVGTHLHVEFGSEVTAFSSLGAARVWRSAPEQVLESAADLVGARRLRAGGSNLPVLDRGFDAVFDCRSTEPSVDLSLRLLRAGGTLVMAGRPGRQSVDWSLVWDRELAVLGTSGHGQLVNGRRALDVARELLGDPSFSVDGLVTHRFPLADIDKALATARAGARTGAVKVVLQDPAAPLITGMHDNEIAVNDDEPLLGAVAARIRNEAE